MTNRRSRVWAVALVFALAGCAAANAPPPAEPAPPAAVPGGESATPEQVAPAEPGGVVSSPPMTEAPPATGAEPAMVWETKDLGVVVPAEWQACASADECELVVTTCCDQCNDGKAVSVLKSRVAEARAKFKPTGCGACTKRGCSTRAACEAGRCVLQWQSFR